MNITYDYYRIFYYVATYKSFSRAAGVLMSNQPNITHFICNLESQLNCQLFIRSNRGVTLTPEGEKLYAHVKIAYEHLSAAEQEITEDQSLASGVITIGCSEIALHSVLLPVLKPFHKKHPGIRLHISNHSTPQALNALKGGLVDFAVVSSPIRNQKDFIYTALTSFNDILVGDKSFSRLTRSAHSLSELKDYPFICLGKDTATYSFFDSLFIKHGLSFHPDTEAATADQLLPIVKAGLGLCFIPEQFAQNELKNGTIIKIPLKDEIPPREIALVENKNSRLSIVANELKKSLTNGKYN